MVEREKLIAVVQGAQRGDDEAAAELYDLFYSDIYYHIMKTVKEPELAADLTQDTFMEILATIGKLEEPTDEERGILHDYREIAYDLNMGMLAEESGDYTYEMEDGDELISDIIRPAEDYYNELAALDKAVIEKWQGSEYLQVDVDYDELMARFTKIEDVLLERVYTYYDKLGNQTKKSIRGAWYYDENGSDRFFGRGEEANRQWIVFSLYDNDVRNPANFLNPESYGMPEYVYDADNRISQIKYYYGDRLEAMVTAQYDAAGNKIADLYTTNYREFTISYSYNDQQQLTQVRYPQYEEGYDLIVHYEYDGNGNISKIVYESYEIQDVAEFGYDANGNLASCVHTHGDIADSYTFTCDDQGRVLTANVTFGGEPYHATAQIENVYGTYYIYTPAEA